jgi:hypothetical protein
MAQTLFLFNPAPLPGIKEADQVKPKGRKSMAKKRARSAAQKAATRRMVAANQARRSTGGIRKRRPNRTRTRTVVMTSNPAPAPSRSRKRRSTKRAASSAGKVLRFRRNPAPRPGGVMSVLKDAGLGAAGSIGVGFIVDKVVSMLPPSVPRSAETLTAATVLGALGVAFVAAKAGQRSTGRAVAVGAITVGLDRLARIYIAKAQAPRVAVPASVNGLELDYSMGESESMGEYVAMGEYDSMGQYVGA